MKTMMINNKKNNRNKKLSLWLIQFVFIIILFVCTFHLSNASPCNLRKVKDGLICVCNETYCDTLDIDFDEHRQQKNQILIVSTSKGGLRFSVKSEQIVYNFEQNRQNIRTIIRNPRRNNVSSTTDQLIDNGGNGSDDAIFSNFFNIVPNIGSSKAINVIITVDQNQTYQKIIGFGGAFTGTVSHLLSKLPKSMQDYLYQSYYSHTNGIGYNLLRIPIGGCDFDLEPWAYNEQPTNDVSLSNFNVLDKRDLDRITQFRELETVTNNHDIKIVGAAWSPPRWMKTNNEWSGAGLLKKEYFRTWAEYHLRYLELMSQQNMTYWGISTGNEPLNGVIGWLFVRFMSLGWTSGEQAKWVAEDLGPLLRNSSFKDLKLLGSDDQRYVFPWWFKQMEAAYPSSLKYLDGFAVHWYWDGIAPPELLDSTKANYPDKFILNTESCIGDKPWQVHGPVLGSWDRGEEYIKAYMQDLQHSVNGWIDWNLMLDQTGGPSYISNTVDSPVIVNIDDKEFYKQPIFYGIGHFSRFIPEDSIRISTESTHNDVIVIGFLRPDNQIAIILYNKSKKQAIINLMDGRKHFNITIPPKSIHSILYAATE